VLAARSLIAVDVDAPARVPLPPAVDTAGYYVAAEALAEVPDERLPPAVEVAAYFVVSESLANVAKHAGATAVSVSLRATDERVVLEVRDDGVGGADPGAGSGLRGLDDRVQALGGRLEVESAPARGPWCGPRSPRPAAT
jgi:glucose-6-phosphate-specific signal transduction histidine kinase